MAFQSPCTLQHGQKLNGIVESILIKTGFKLISVADGHICCGSAGVFSLLQPELSEQLLNDKLLALRADGPDVIATANIGCLMHLRSGGQDQIKHWIELFAE